jgi:hypothetical protein
MNKCFLNIWTFYNSSCNLAPKINNCNPKTSFSFTKRSGTLRHETFPQLYNFTLTAAQEATSRQRKSKQRILWPRGLGRGPWSLVHWTAGSNPAWGHGCLSLTPFVHVVSPTEYASCHHVYSYTESQIIAANSKYFTRSPCCYYFTLLQKLTNNSNFYENMTIHYLYTLCWNLN